MTPLCVLPSIQRHAHGCDRLIHTDAVEHQCIGAPKKMTRFQSNGIIAGSIILARDGHCGGGMGELIGGVWPKADWRVLALAPSDWAVLTYLTPIAVWKAFAILTRKRLRPLRPLHVTSFSECYPSPLFRVGGRAIWEHSHISGAERSLKQMAAGQCFWRYSSR